VIGTATETRELIVEDTLLGDRAVDLPMPVLFGKPPQLHREVQRQSDSGTPFDYAALELVELTERILRLPTVGSKNFLITIGDRSVTGMVARDQMVGPWQVPVADVAVTTSGYSSYTGEAMSMGERTPLALLNAPASGRMAVGEALTNMAAARIDSLSQIKLSANWMAAAGWRDEDARLFDTVRAVGMELCPELGIAIPVGKDSLSMRTVWEEKDEQKSVVSPLSLIVTAFAPVLDVRQTLTPQLDVETESTVLFLIDLGGGKDRMGGSALAQVYNQVGHTPPDLDQPQQFKQFFDFIQALNHQGKLLAYHDRSDGGVWVTLLEMAFAGRCGLAVEIPPEREEISFLMNEELGAVIQVSQQDADSVIQLAAAMGLEEICLMIGKPTQDQQIEVYKGDTLLFSEQRVTLHRIWSETSWRMQTLRDNPECALEEYDDLLDASDPGLIYAPAFDPQENICAPFVHLERPRVAILREQGVNGQIEMAAAFERARFETVDVHMSDLLEGRLSLDQFQGVVACGGFSYGDVLGAGEGWAKTILFNDRLRDQFEAFFARSDRFALGVCNGCQMMARLKEMIPGADLWPRFVRNRSEQFEARFSQVEVLSSPSIFLQGMEGSLLPVVVSHGEGRAEFSVDNGPKKLATAGLAVLRYVDHYGSPTQRYPANPNGSPDGITGLTTPDGRFTIMMPHPERVFRSVQNSWLPKGQGEDAAWLRMFRNARIWCAGS
jgi:phosphoribosylformylglycinamidine synthase